MLRTILSSFALSVTLVCLTVVQAGAQTTFGSISGVVKDQSGGVLAGATVTVLNEGTGVQRQVLTADTGVFNATNLPVGSYTVRIDATGMRRHEQTGLVLNANQVIGVDVQLGIASAASEVVEVAGTAPVINTETGALTYTKNSRDMLQLPFVSRTAGDIGFLGFTYANPGVSKGANIPTINGMRTLDTIPTMDGITVMAYPTNSGGGPIQPSFEGIAQVNIQLAGTDAEFARSSNLTVVTKSGSNQYHGAAYWNYNGNRLNARNFFATDTPFRAYHDFSTSLGGPIRKNKTFFFGDYEGSREVAQQLIVGNTPLLAWRGGDFSGLSSAIKDPLTNAAFPGNQIPASRLDPTALKVQNYFFPLPNFGAASLQSGNWRAQLPGLTGFTQFDHFDTRVDHNFSSKDMAFARVSYRRLPYYQHTQNLPPVGEQEQLRQSRSAVASWTHLFSATVLNEFRTGMARNLGIFGPKLVGADIIQQLGIQGISLPSPGTSAFLSTGVPSFKVTGITSTDVADGGGGHARNVNTNFEWTDNLSITRGDHFMKFGFDVIRDQVGNITLPSTNFGSYSFTGAYTGLGYADLLLGIPQTTTRTLLTPPSYLRGTMWSAYAQDQFKISSRLTLNYGIRWELAGPYYDRYGTIFSFNPSDGSVIIPDKGVPALNPLYPKNIPVVTASKDGYPANSLLTFNKTNFYPRFGFAFKPFNNNKTVIRGGYGIYGNMIYGAAAKLLQGGPFSGSETFTNALTNGVPLFRLPNPFLNVGTTATQNVTGINPNLRTPYSQQFNFTLERQIQQIGLRFAYVGTRSTALAYTANINQPRPSTTPYSASRRTFPVYNTVTWYDNGGTQQYNALQVSASKTYGENLSFNTGWTWAKDLTDTQNSSGFAGPLIQDAYNRRAERGDNVLTRQHRVYINTIYNLPVGRGQRLLNKAGGLIDAFVGGWSTSLASTMESGPYYTPTFSGFDPSNTNSLGPSTNFIARPDRIASGTLSSGQSINQFFDASAFKVPGCPDTVPLCANPVNVGRFGNSGVNILRGPSLVNFDFSAMKYFRVNERIRVQLRMASTNIFNHPNFTQPAANISSPGTVGRITSTFQEQLGEGSRQVHFSLRVEF